MTLIDGRIFFDRSTAPTLENLMQQIRERQQRRRPAAATEGGAR